MFSMAAIIFIIYFILSMLSKETFTYTHFPIRLNRKTRMAHIFRKNGTILNVSWDKLIFTIGRTSRRRYGIQQTYIASNCMDASDSVQDIKIWGGGTPSPTRGRIIRETFVLGGYLTADLGKTLSLWEFFRRYMEEGPEAVTKDIPIYCLPIDKHKESFDLGLTMIRFSQWSSSGFLVELFSIFLFFEALARWVAMMTCRIPIWPKEVEDACTIEPDDPFMRDGSTNSHRQSELGPESMKFRIERWLSAKVLCASRAESTIAVNAVQKYNALPASTQAAA